MHVFRELYHKYKDSFKVKLLYIDKGIDDSALRPRIRELEDQLDISSILIAREHGQSEVNFLTFVYRTVCCVLCRVMSCRVMLCGVVFDFKFKLLIS